MFYHPRKTEAGCPGELAPYHCSGKGFSGREFAKSLAQLT
jgi:hypothetical protein